MIGIENSIKVSRRALVLLVFLALSTIVAGPAYADLSCNACHTMPPLDSASGNRQPASGAFKGNHQGHSSNSVASCLPCHGAAVSSYTARHSAPPPGSGAKPVIRLTSALNNYSISHTLASYSRGTFFNQTSVPPNPLGTCSNVNCHFESVTPAWGTANFASPTDCDKCHGAPPSAIDPGSHAKHNTYYPGVTNCQKCHTNNTTFQHATSAGNRPLNVSFAAAPNNGSGAYSGQLNDYLPSQNNTFGNCTATYCHSPGTKGTAPYAAPNQAATWGGTLGCGGCHAAPAAIELGSHYKHVASSYGVSVECYKCHAATVTAGMTISSTANHVNKKVDIVFNSTTTAVFGKYSGHFTPMQKNPGSGYANCENVYCHSNAQGANGTGPVTYATPKWGSQATGRCGTCHGAAIHTATSITSGSHTKHLSYNFDGALAANPCGSCHWGAGFTAASCSQCHTGSGKLTTLHVNHNVDVSFVTKFGGTYSGTTEPGDIYGSCASNYCHSDGKATPTTYTNPTWGNAGSGACGTCHGVTAAAPPASTPHIEHVGSTSPYLFACDACHSTKVQATANSTIQPAYTNLTSHVNKSRDVKFNAGSPFGTYSSASQSCRNIYCHSTGNLNVTAGALPAVYNGKKYTRQTWSGALACNGCHGRSSANGMPDYTNGGAATATANSHPKHVSSSVIACVECHEKTTKNGTAVRNTVPSKHVDGTTHDVFFNLSSKNASGTYNNTRQRCYSIYCHSNGTTASGFATYSTPAWGNTLNCNGCHKSSFVSGSNISTGSHGYHINWVGASAYAQDIKCVKCHAVTAKADMTILNGSRHTNGQVEIAFNNTSSAANGSYIGTPATPASPMSKAPGSAKGQCTNVYCHSSGQTDNAGPPTYYTTPAWGTSDMAFCGKCHGVPYSHGSFGTVTPLVTGSHVKHLKYRMSDLNSEYDKCVVCHAYYRTGYSTSSCNQALCHGPIAQKHSNYEINVGIPVFFGASAAYNGTTKPGHDGAGYANSTCSLVYCHSNGLATSPTYVTPKWGDPATAACGTCHGAKADALPASTRHSKHVGSAGQYQYACALCHAGIVKHNANSSTYAVISTATDTIQFNGSRLHVNKSRDVLFDTINPFGRYSSYNQSCNSAYCHSTGKTRVAAARLPGVYNGKHYAKPKWTDAGTLACNACHGRSTSDGMPDYINGKMGSMSSNSHAKHVTNSAIACVECHEKTTKTGTTIRNTFPSKHVNGSSGDVFFNLSGNNTSGVYTAGTKTCTTVACHSNGRGTYVSAQWGVNANCDYCHPIASLGGSHSKHVDFSQMPTFYSYTANNSTTNAHNFGCSNCHPLIASQHAKGSITLDLRPTVGSSMLRSKNNAAITASGPVNTANSGTTGTTGTNVVCLNVYCHSNGYSNNTVFATTPNWYGGTFTGDKCAACHGNSPNSTVVGSPAHYNADFAGIGNPGGHLVGIHYDNIYSGTSGLATAGALPTSSHGDPTTSTSLNCDNCHFTTVESRNNDKNTVCTTCHNGANLRGDAVIASRVTHVNGRPDVVFDAIQVRSKAQLSAQSNYTTAFTRVGGYKTSGSYDIAKTTLDTATMWNSSTKTCSNVSCHFNKPINWSNTGSAYKCRICHDSM